MSGNERQRMDNERNPEKRRTLKRSGLAIVRIQNFYAQDHDSDEDGPFPAWMVRHPQSLTKSQQDYIRLRGISPGTGRYTDTIADGALPTELERLSYVFDEMVMMTLTDIGIEVREHDISLKGNMPDVPRHDSGRCKLTAEIRLLMDAEFDAFEDAIVWMYRVVRMYEIAGEEGSSLWRTSKGVMSYFMNVLERAVFHVDEDEVQKVWMALYNKLRVYWHNELRQEVTIEIFDEDCRTMRVVQSCFLGARAYCRVISFTREETSLFRTAVMSPIERGLLY